jgi:queuine/archaeosine tRNA-ribosyltransferase
MDGCKTHSRKIAAIFNLQKQIIETRARKKLRGLVEQGKCRLCEMERETVHHLVAGCSKLVSTEHTRKHNNALMILVVQRGIQHEMLPKETKWHKNKWERRKVIEGTGGRDIGTGNIG